MIRSITKQSLFSRKTLGDVLSVVIISLLFVLLVLIWQFARLSASSAQKAVKTTKQTKALWQFSIYNYRDKGQKSLDFPYDSAFDNAGNIYVTDSGSGRVLKYSPNGVFISFYDGRAGQTLHTPLGIAINEDGIIAVADKRLSHIALFDPDFKLIRKIPEVFPIKPLFVKDKLYVSTFKRLAIYSKNGKLIEATGSRGKGLGQFDFPNGLAVANDRVYVSDSNNHRIQAFSKDPFALLWVEGQPVQSADDKDRKFDLPAGMTSDEDGFLYLVDNFDCSIKLLNKDGYQLAIIGDYGAGEGNFKYPTGITYAGNNRFAIVDRGNSRVQIIDIYPAKPGFANASKSAKATAIILFLPFLSFRGLLLGLVTIALFVLTYLQIKKQALLATGA